MTAAEIEFECRTSVASDSDSVVALFWTDLDGIVTAWTTTAETLLGWTAADAIGQPPPFVGEAAVERWRCACECVKFGAFVRRVDLVAITSRGRAVPVRISCGPSRDVAGEKARMLFIMAGLVKGRGGSGTY